MHSLSGYLQIVLQFHAFYIYRSGFWDRNMDILHNLKQTFNLSLVMESHESSLKTRGVNSPA